MTAVKTPATTGLLVTGVALAILGIAALVSPVLAGTWIVYIVGGLLTLGGLLHVLQGVRSEGTTRKLSMIIMGLIVTIAGVVILLNADLSLQMLTIIITVYFLVSGGMKIFASFSYRPAGGWLAMLISGLISLALGAIIWSQLPQQGVWIVGILVGIDLLVSGIALVVLAVTVRKLKQKLKEAALT